MFIKRSKNERGQVEFINSALKYLKDYGLHKDIEVYKALLKVFPVGPLLPQNVWQVCLFYFNLLYEILLENVLALSESSELLHQSSGHNGVASLVTWLKSYLFYFFLVVYPDMETFEIVKARFGNWSFATKKIRRMMFWYPRLRYTNKYLDRKLKDDRYINLTFAELAKMGLEMMSRESGAQITYSTVS